MITPVERVVQLLQEFAQFPLQAEILNDHKLRVALELYAAHFSEVSVNARFLTLVMALEALATGEKRPKPILELLERWGQDIERLKASCGSASGPMCSGRQQRPPESRRDEECSYARGEGVLRTLSGLSRRG